MTFGDTIMVKIVKGDLFDHAKEGIIAHGCNCRGGFGAGFVVPLANKYPEAKNKYVEKFLGDGWKLGDVQFVIIDSNILIANCATQDRYWKLVIGEVLVSYPALNNAMKKVANLAKRLDCQVHIPFIGAGLAGGDKTKIMAVFLDAFKDVDCTLYVT